MWVRDGRAGAKTLGIAALSLVYSTAECCTPVWCRSVHSCLIGIALNDALRIIAGCLRFTPKDNLLILACIQPAGLCRQKATLFLANRSILDFEHLLHNHLIRPLDSRKEKLKPRRPFVSALLKLLDNRSELDIRVGERTDFTWNMEYLNRASKLYNFIPRVGFRPLKLGLSRPAWVRLNRLQTGVGLFRPSMHKWSLALSCNCECGANEQTANHIISVCPTHRTPKGRRCLSIADAGSETLLPSFDKRTTTG